LLITSARLLSGRSYVSSSSSCLICLFYFFNAPATTEISPLSLHDALPISPTTFGRTEPDRHPIGRMPFPSMTHRPIAETAFGRRSEEHTSELQSRFDLVCRLLLEKKKTNKTHTHTHRSQKKTAITDTLPSA